MFGICFRSIYYLSFYYSFYQTYVLRKITTAFVNNNVKWAIWVFRAVMENWHSIDENMYFKQISCFYKFYVRIQVIKYYMNPNISLNNSRKIPPILRQKSLNEVSYKTSVTIQQTFATYLPAFT